MEFSDLKFPDNLSLFTTEELRSRYKLLLEELINRRDFVFDNHKTNLQEMLQTIHDEGYKLQVVDYDDSEKKIEIKNIYQFDVYDPVIETSEI